MSMMGSSRYEFEPDLLEKDIQAKYTYIGKKSIEASKLIDQFVDSNPALRYKHMEILLDSARRWAEENEYFKNNKPVAAHLYKDVDKG